MSLVTEATMTTTARMREEEAPLARETHVVARSRRRTRRSESEEESGTTVATRRLKVRRPKKG